MRSLHSKNLLCVLVCSFVLSLTFQLGLANALPGKDALKERDGERAWLLAERIRKAVRIKKENRKRLFDISGVVGTGVGLDPDGEPMIRVFTARPGIAQIPARLDGVPVRTKVTGRFYALQEAPQTYPYQRWERPVPIGVSTGHPDITAGTIGCRVRDPANQKVFALSNNHVYANMNNATIGDQVLQPGAFDGGALPDDYIGTLADFEPIQFCTLICFWIWCFPDECPDNPIDAAIAESTPDLLGNATPATDQYGNSGYGTPDPVIYGDGDGDGDFDNINDLLGLSVKKFGRTTGMTYGQISETDVTVDVCYDDTCTNMARFVDQLIITPGSFSGGGDSGSLIVTQEGNHPVGLLFAGSDVNTVANRIDLVLNRFDVAVDSGPQEPLTDIAVTLVEAPASVLEDETVQVLVTVQNAGNEDVSGSISVSLYDNGAYLSEQEISGGLTAGDSTVLAFTWRASLIGEHTLTATHDLVDDNAENNSYSAVVNVAQVITDIAVTSISAPGSVVEGNPAVVDITVENVGNQNVSSNIQVSLTEEGFLIDTQTIYGGLAPGASAPLSLTWNTESIETGDYTLTVAHDFSDDNLANNSQSTTVSVTEQPVAGPHLQTGQVWASTERWETVYLTYDYGPNMVVVCTPNYDEEDPSGFMENPLVVRVQTFGPVGDQFQVRLAPAVAAYIEPREAWVHWMVVERGVYTVAEHGVKMEAAKFSSSVTDHIRSWVAQPREYQQSYAQPVVLGQVMTSNGKLWSTFWCRSESSATTPPNGTLRVGKHSAQDRRRRTNEIVGYIVIEAGSGSIEGFGYVAALGPDQVQGVQNNPPYTYGLSDVTFIPSGAIATQAAMDDGDGGWAILYGDNPVTNNSLNLAIEEDWYRDAERRHETEQVGYIVFGY